PDTTVDASIRAAAALATAYLARKDRVGLIEYCGPFRWVRPDSGRAQHERLLEALLRADVMFSYVTQEVALVPRRVLPPQALVIAISPLLDARFEKAVVDLAARGFDVAVLSPSPIPLVQRAHRASTSVDLACRLWTLERNARAEALRRLGIAIVEWDPAEPLQAALVGLTGARRRRAARGARPRRRRLADSPLGAVRRGRGGDHACRSRRCERGQRFGAAAVGAGARHRRRRGRAGRRRVRGSPSRALRRPRRGARPV